MGTTVYLWNNFGFFGGGAFPDRRLAGSDKAGSFADPVPIFVVFSNEGLLGSSGVGFYPERILGRNYMAGSNLRFSTVALAAGFNGLCSGWEII